MNINIFEDFIENSKAAAAYAGQKAGKFIDISKLRLCEATLTCDINKCLKKLGAVYYKSIKAKIEMSEKIETVDIIAEIDTLIQQRRAVRELIEKVKNRDCGSDDFVD